MAVLQFDGSSESAKQDRVTDISVRSYWLGGDVYDSGVSGHFGRFVKCSIRTFAPGDPFDVWWSHCGES